MTKIIRKRNKLKCGLCKSTFRFESEDVKEKVYELNGGHSYYYVSCPVCKSEKVTSFWIQEVENDELRKKQNATGYVRNCRYSLGCE